MSITDLAKSVESAVAHHVENAIGHYLSSNPADREALTRLQAEVARILLLAEKVPDALKDAQDTHTANAKAQADAAKAAKEPPPAPKSQAPARG